MTDPHDADFVIPDDLLDCKYKVFRVHACVLIIAGEPARTKALGEIEPRLRSTMESEIWYLSLQAKLLGVDAQAFAISLKEKLLDLASSPPEPRTLH